MENDIQMILEAILKLSQKIDTITKDKVEPNSLTTEPRGSSNLGEIYAALAKAQAEMRIAELNKSNPYFKSRYSDLQAIVEASRPALTKNGLAVFQEILTNPDGQTVLHTVLTHSSGQFVESRMRIVPPKNDIQTISSYITYLKRISYASLVGVVTGDEDDDGELCTAPFRDEDNKGTALNRKYNPKENSVETISKDQLDELEYELQQYPDIAEKILEGFKLQHLCDMSKNKYLTAIKRVREIKQLRNEGTNKK